MSYYGRKHGIFRSWDDCEVHVNGYTGTAHKRFSSSGAARDLMGQGKVSLSYRQNRRSPYAFASRYLRYRGYCPRSRSAPASERDTEEHNSISIDSPHYKIGYPGVFFSDDYPVNSARPAAVHLMNNYEENESSIETAIMTNEMGLSRLQINTDGRYLINSKENRINRCKRNNWRNDSDMPVVNQVVNELREMERAFNGLDVKLEYVPGNAGICCNKKTEKLSCDSVSKSSHQDMSVNFKTFLS